MDALLKNKPTQVYEEILERFMRSWKILNGDFPLDQQMAEAYTREMYERSLHPVGVAWNHIHCQEGIGDLSNVGVTQLNRFSLCAPRKLLSIFLVNCVTPIMN